jgi:hypothetical protein
MAIDAKGKKIRSVSLFINFEGLQSCQCYVSIMLDLSLILNGDGFGYS